MIHLEAPDVVPGHMIYLDHNATTPPHPRVLDAMRTAAERAWANPASVHGAGRAARAYLERAREEVAALVGAHPRDVVLTSGGTEANNLALWHAFADTGGASDGVLVTSRIEHPSIVRTAEALARRGVEVRWATPSEEGRIDATAIERALTGVDRVAVITLQAVNHETGVIQSVEEVAALAARRGAHLVVDAVQAVGRIDASPLRHADVVTIAGHKIRGPKGIGALVARPGIKLRPLLLGGEQERGIRPGTQDAALAAGLAVAVARAREGGPERYARLAPLRDALEARLVALGEELGIAVRVNARGRGAPPSPIFPPHPSPALLPQAGGGRGCDVRRAPHVTNLSFEGWEGAALAAALDLEGVAVSSGSACSAGTARPSPVIAAMLGRERARSALRISLGEETREAEIDAAFEAFDRVLRRGS